MAPNPWYHRYQTAWATGVGGPIGANFRASLDGHDGSLLVTCQKTNGDETIVYTSNVGDPQTLDDYTSLLQRTHKLVITEECVLKTHRDWKVVWTNGNEVGSVVRLGEGSGVGDGVGFLVGSVLRAGQGADISHSSLEPV